MPQINPYNFVPLPETSSTQARNIRRLENINWTFNVMTLVLSCSSILHEKYLFQ